MSSLRTIIRKGKMFVHDSIRTDQGHFHFYSDLVNFNIHHLQSPDTILVNIQSVYLDMTPWHGPGSTGTEKLTVEAVEKVVGYFGDPESAPPRPMPPFANMWLEYEHGQDGVRQKHGFLIHRTTFDDSILHIVPETAEKFQKQQGITTYVDMFFWTHDAHGWAWIMGAGTYGLSDAGDFIYSARFLLDHKGLLADSRRMQMQFRQGLILHALARMNCANATLRVMNEGKSAPHYKPQPLPASVWHTIHVDPAPKMRTTGRNAMPEEPVPQRLHWIRGHYADYRRGAGLFGNPKLKKTFWIPEHTAGCPELGKVIPEYVVH